MSQGAGSQCSIPPFTEREWIVFETVESEFQDLSWCGRLGHRFVCRTSNNFSAEVNAVCAGDTMPAKAGEAAGI